MSRVAVIGAGGYVGPYMCRSLLERGHQVTGIGRPHARIALAPLGVPVRPGIGDGAEFDVVVNLAYPTGGTASDVPRQNRALLEQMRAVGHRGGRVIHVSTLAVFGYALEFPPQLGPVPRRRDFEYIESKIQLERGVWKAFKRHDAHVVRLGNVWGPASPNWTAGLAHALLFGLPSGVMGQDGYSNVTDVANVAAFLSALVDAPATGSLQFHHLAEFSSQRWSHWVGLLAGALGVEPEFAASRPVYASAFWPEFLGALGPGGPVAVYRRCVYGRYTGSWARSVVGLVPRGLFALLKRRAGRRPVAPASSGEDDPILLELFACQREFRTQVAVNWWPSVDAEQSWERVKSWLESSGYTNGGGPSCRS